MRPWLVLVLLVSGCYPDPGPCDDQSLALEIVYDAQGSPAFAGQGVIIQSCGGGGFCHSDTVAGVDMEDEAAVAEAIAARRGAPAGLNFDLRLAMTSAGADVENHRRLRADQIRVLGMAGQVLWQVQTGSMPPGELGDATGGFRVYDRFMDDGVSVTPLPRLASADPGDPVTDAEVEEATEILQTWLACGAPVIERSVLDVRLPRELTDLPADAPAGRGFEVRSCDRNCIDVRWPVIYSQVIQPTCTGSECHDATDSAAQLDLTGGAAAAHARIFDVAARGRQCGLGASPPSIVDSMVADDSLLLQKLEATSSDEVCGSPMPLVGNQLGAQRQCVIRAWVECGACPEADGGSCAACLDAARATCNYDAAAANGCSVSDPCPNRLDL